MKDQYTVDDILQAVEELQDLKKNKVNKRNIVEEEIKAIPKNTLRLIEEAEKNIKN